MNNAEFEGAPNGLFQTMRWIFGYVEEVAETDDDGLEPSATSWSGAPRIARWADPEAEGEQERHAKTRWGFVSFFWWEAARIILGAARGFAVEPKLNITL